MKLLLLSLALALLAGSRAVVIREAPEQVKETKLSAFFHEWEKFLEDLNNATEKRWEQFMKSKTGKMLEHLLEDEEGTEAPKQEEKKEDKCILDSLIDVLGDVADVAEKALEELDKASLPALKKFNDAVDDAVGKQLEPLMEKLEPHLKSLLHALVNKIHQVEHDLDEVFPQQLELLDQHVPPYLQKLTGHQAKESS